MLRARTDRFAFYKAMWSPDGRQQLLGCFDAAGLTRYGASSRGSA